MTEHLKQGSQNGDVEDQGVQEAPAETNEELASTRERIGENSRRTSSFEADDPEETVALLKARIECLERISGIPRRDATCGDKLQMWITYQVNHKLSIFGIRLGACFAIMVLLCDIAFVVGFSRWQMDQCVPTMSFIDGNFNAEIYIGLYKEPGNVFLCTTEYANTDEGVSLGKFLPEFTNDNGESVVCSTRVACTLNGFTEADYDVRNRVCPIAHAGCSRPYSCTNTVTNAPEVPRRSSDYVPRASGQLLFNNSAWVPPFESCGSGAPEETLCVGSTSITYYVCPRLGTVVGAALGYLFLVEIVALVLIAGTFFVVSGRRYRFEDLTTAFGAPTETVDGARAKRLAAATENEGSSDKI